MFTFPRRPPIRPLKTQISPLRPQIRLSGLYSTLLNRQIISIRPQIITLSLTISPLKESKAASNLPAQTSNLLFQTRNMCCQITNPLTQA